MKPARQSLNLRDSRRPGEFITTHWSVVVAAGQSSGSEAAMAFEKLFLTYWYPLYSYVRRCGSTPEDAQDLTQGFFAHVMRKNSLGGLKPEKGKFRSFLLACLKHFLADEWDKACATKRSMNRSDRLIDFEEAEKRYCSEFCAEASAETLYERRWALELLNHALDQLRLESVRSGKGAVFDLLQDCLAGERTLTTYAQIGAQLHMSETSIKITVHRLRRRYRELLREQIAQTVSRPEEVDEELRYLFCVVSR